MLLFNLNGVLNVLLAVVLGLQRRVQILIIIIIFIIQRGNTASLLDMLSIDNDAEDVFGAFS